MMRHTYLNMIYTFVSEKKEIIIKDIEIYGRFASDKQSNITAIAIG